MLPVRSPENKQAGITLIEILVTMIILAIGLLGLAGLMMDGLKNNQSAYLRTQASILAYDMSDRIRINRDRAIAGDYDGYSTSGEGGFTNLPACVTNAAGCSAADQVNQDLAEWTREIQGVGGTALLPDGEGSITRGGGNLFTITVGWQETLWDEESDARVTDLQQFAVEFSL